MTTSDNATARRDHADALDQLRAAMPAVDPAALNHADRAALIHLIERALDAKAAK